MLSTNKRKKMTKLTKRLKKLLAICLLANVIACGNNTIDEISCELSENPIKPQCLKVGEEIEDIDNEWDTQDTCSQTDEINEAFRIINKLCY